MAVEAHLRQEKVKKFEDFVDRQLKPDLVNAIAQRDNLFQQQKTLCEQLGSEEEHRKFGKEWCNEHAIHGQSWLRGVHAGRSAGHEAHFCGYWSRFSCGIYLARGFAVYICKRSKVGQTNR